MMGNASWISTHQNETLRFVSATFRTIDGILADKGRPGGLMALAAPFLNSYAGTKFSPKDLYNVFAVMDPLSPWNTQTKYFVTKTDPRYYVTAYQAFIDSSVKAKLLPAGLVPDDGIWSGQIYSTLKWYQTETDAITKALAGKSLSAKQKALLAQSAKYYKWYDFLDSFRYARAAATA